MAILFNETTSTFTLLTKQSMYQMKADKYGVLLHTYYGKKGAAYDYSYLITYADHGFSGNPYEVGDDRTYSLDVLPQEYPVYGSGDYRPTALKIRYPDGSCACELRYAGYQIKKGKYALPGLPTVYAEEDSQADTLIITLEDTRKLADLFWRKGIGIDTCFWGYDTPHDRPSWERQLQEYLPRMV